jgi:cyclopropane fatty-acyl-phospholipid synthase-like methyltransferase
MKLTLVTILSLNLMLISCNSKTIKSEQKPMDTLTSKKSEDSNTDHNKSNIHMNKVPFNNLVNRFEDTERENWQKPDLIINKLGDLGGKTVGDIGSGTGYFSFRLAEQDANVIAIDVDRKFIAYIEKKKKEEKVINLTTRLVGYNNPNLSDNEFDALLIVNTYHHFNEKIEYLNFCKQGLKPDGILMIVDFKKRKTSHGPPVEHRIAVEEVKKDIQNSGFNKIEIDTVTLAEQYIITVVK